MSASRALRRTSGKQLQFAGPWSRARSPATTVPGVAPIALFPSDSPTRVASSDAEKPGRHQEFVSVAEPTNAVLYSAN